MRQDLRYVEQVLTAVWDLHVRSGASRVLPQCLALGFLLLPRAVCSLAAVAAGAGFTVTSRFRGNRSAYSQDGGAIRVHVLGTLVVPWKRPR